MCGDASKERLLRLEVTAWVCREETEGMGAEEVMWCFIVQLPRDSKEREDFMPVEETEGLGIEIDYAWSGSEYQRVYLVAQLRR